MAKAATHRGTCQICGRDQKLPGTVLSKHGYTKELGWFMGTCTGAGSRPFEQSCDRIKEHVEFCEASIERLEVQKQTDSVWISLHHRHVGSRWHRFDRDAVRVEGGRVHHPQVDGVWSDHVDTYDHRDPLGKLHERYVKKLIRKQEQLRHHVAWQRGRMLDWAPAELRPV